MTRLTPQVAAGATFAAIGMLGIVLAHGYETGTATHMGPGYFPTCLSILILLLGMGAVLQSLLRGDRERLPALELVDLSLLLLGVVVFGMLIERAGLLAAVAGLVVPVCLPRVRRRPLEVLLVYVAISVFCGLVFIRAFGLPFEWW